MQRLKSTYGDSRLVQRYAQGPSVFIENAGQWDAPDIKYALDSQGMNVGLTDMGLKFQLCRQQESTTKNVARLDRSEEKARIPGQATTSAGEMHEFSLIFDGAQPVTPVGRGLAESGFNYIVGPPEMHRTNVASYHAIWYENLYPGISLEITGRRSGVKYNFHVAPNADLRAIRLRYEGIQTLARQDNGTLEINLAEGWEPIIDGTPYIYQEVEGSKTAVTGQFVLYDDSIYGVEVIGVYDLSLPLIIDPEVDWSTYLGGEYSDWGSSIAVDGSGNIYITGSTRSSGWGVSNSWDSSLTGIQDGFVVKLSNSGEHQWSTYLGGSGDTFRGEFASDIAIASSGNIYVAGQTQSSGWVSGGYDTILHGISDVFVVKLSSAGAHAWSTYVGGNNIEDSGGIAVDGNENVFVCGETQSAGWVSGGYDNSYITSLGDEPDGFVAKLSSAGLHLWSTYVGGSSYEYTSDVAVDNSGNVYVCGNTCTKYWLTNGGGWDGTLDGEQDGFLIKLSPDGQHIWSTYLGGSSYEDALDLGVDSNANVYVVGWTQSTIWIDGVGIQPLAGRKTVSW